MREKFHNAGLRVIHVPFSTVCIIRRFHHPGMTTKRTDTNLDGIAHDTPSLDGRLLLLGYKPVHVTVQIKLHEIKPNTSENDAIKWRHINKMYEAAASVPRYIVLQQTSAVKEKERTLMGAVR